MSRKMLKLIAITAITALPSMAMASPVLTNGGFEDNPPPNFGNNVGHGIAPWVLGSGNQSNVIKVDGPGGQSDGSHGPESDASAPGAGTDQHYLDIAWGANDFYQVFTPLCSGEVQYGAYFSTRDNRGGEAGVTILQDSDLSVVGPRQAVNLPGGNSQFDPWEYVVFTTTVTANTAYRFHVDMDNNMNMDNAFVVFKTQCDAHEPPDFYSDPLGDDTPDPDPVPEPVQCTPFTPEASYDAATGVTEVHLTNAQSGSFDPTGITVTSQTGGVTVSADQGGDPLNFALSGAAPGQSVTLVLDAVQQGAGGDGLDLCCSGEITITIPEPVTEYTVDKTCVAGQTIGPTTPYTCSITVTADGPVTGTLTVSDLMQMTGVNGDPNTLIGGISSSDPWACGAAPYSAQAPAACSIAGGQFPASGSSTLTVGLSVPGALLDQAQLSNCASAAVDGAEVAGPSCFSFNDAASGGSGDTGGGTPTDVPEVNVFKECEPITQVAQGSLYPLQMTCRIKVQPLVPYTGQITINDVVSNLFGGGGFQFSGPPTVDPSVWNCATQPQTLSCVADGSSYPVDGNGNPQETTIDVSVDFTDVGTLATWQNCAEANYAGPGNPPLPVGDNCDQQSFDLSATTSAVAVTKICNGLAPGPAGLEMQCSITVFTTNTVNSVTIDDIATQLAGSQGGTVSSITPNAPNWACTTTGGGTQNPGGSCVMTSGTLEPNAPVTLDVVMTIPEAPGTTSWRNCAQGSYVSMGDFNPAGSTVNILQNCSEGSYTAAQKMAQVPQVPQVTLGKTSDGPCSVDVASQSYGCDFTLRVTNPGGAAYDGPLALNDSADLAVTTKMQAPKGWSCVPGGKGGTCSIGAAGLAPGAALDLPVSMTVPGLPQGGALENCASFGAAGKVATVRLVQSAMQSMGIDGGPVDGSPGRKTRAGVRQLQERLGLAPDGQITPALLEALGMPAAAPVCVSVDLPPMPAPPLSCDAGTTRLISTAEGPACECRYSNMYQRDKASCACTKGRDFVPGKGCVKRVAKPNCERLSTVARGGACVCRYKNMYQRNATACGCIKGTKFAAGKGCIRPRKTQKPEVVCPGGQVFVRGEGCVRRGKPKGEFIDDSHLGGGDGGGGAGAP